MVTESGIIKPINIVEEMKNSYLDYAMSVIVSRALPDVRDGLKPVQRRILYAINELGIRHNTPYKKSARIVGEVLGKYHPHGDSPVYEAMVRMAQPFSLRYELIDGQGNFGSIDNDPPAAMRYTEARMSEIAGEMMADIEKETVNFVPNFDGSLKEPSVLPSRMPNLLLNGGSGIAVGMATNIPPNNLGEICDGLILLIDNPEVTVEELNEIVKGPDFPTAGIIVGVEGIKSAYATGRGRLVIRGRVHFEEIAKGNREQIVITELPYQVNKATLAERIAALVKEKRLEGISEIRDESDRDGIRLVIELRKETQPEKVVNNLYKYTSLQTAFAVNMLALVDGQPKVISLKEAAQHYIDFRVVTIERRSRFDLAKAKARAHILEGLRIALENLDEVINTIRQAENAEAARTNLMSQFQLSQEQAQAILDMQLRRLAALERQKILNEYTEVLGTISYLEDLLANPRKVLYLVKEEIGEIKKKYGDKRRTEIIPEELTAFSDEDLVPHQAVVISISNKGYIKRVPVDVYKSQKRGGRGIIGHVMREADGIRHLLVADTHDSVLYFSNMGKVYMLKVYEIPADSSRTGKGTPITNLMQMDFKEQVTTVVRITNFDADLFMVLATSKGEIKKTALKNFSSVRSNGLIAMNLETGDELMAARIASEKDDVIMVNENGRAIRFCVDNLRLASRTSGGVKGMKLADGGQVVGVDVCYPDSYLLVLTKLGFGKMSPTRLYPAHKRNGYGMATLRIKEHMGKIVAARAVFPEQELLIMSADGIMIRTRVGNITIKSRNTLGVHLMRMDPEDKVVSMAIFDHKEDTGEEASDTKKP
ncbi:MAG: DNA gyrase subunit A [Dehalococcoidia bacterium]|nr:DNA gyrase subunit A [Dehalococcoidia bacterium]